MTLTHFHHFKFILPGLFNSSYGRALFEHAFEAKTYERHQDTRSSNMQVPNNNTPQVATPVKLATSSAALQTTFPPPPPPPPPPPMNPCKIYVIDAANMYATKLGLPKCRLREAWPFESLGAGVDGLDSTPHWASRHASGHWVAENIRASPYYTENIRKADLWYVNSHCYALWHESLWHLAKRDPAAPLFSPFNHISAAISNLFVYGVMQMSHFTRTAGRRVIISRPTAGSPPGGMMDTCARLKRSFFLASERAVFCDNDRDRAANGDSLILPLVVVEGLNVTGSVRDGPERTIFLYYQSRCPIDMDNLDKNEILTEIEHGASLAGEPSMLGQRLLSAMHAELGQESDLVHAWDDIHISCSPDKDPTQAEVLDAMRRAIFCPVMAHGTQATRALPAAVLSGCIPVFFGEPYHAMPLAGDIDYPSIAVFFNITESGKEPPPATEDEAWKPQPPGELEINAGIEGALVAVSTFTDALKYLREIPKERIEAMQAAIDAERLKYYYPLMPGGTMSPAGEIIVKRMCEYATKLNATLDAQAAERAARLDKLP